MTGVWAALMNQQVHAVCLISDADLGLSGAPRFAHANLCNYGKVF